MSLATGVIFLATSLPSSAHEDPPGDVHPAVVVENGNFAVYFSNNTPGRFQPRKPSPIFRSLYSPGGRMLAPRHQVSAMGTSLSDVYLQRFHNEKPVAWVSSEDRGIKVMALAWPADDRIAMVESATLSPTHLAVAVKLKLEDPDRTSAALYLYLFPRKGFAPPERFEIDFPSTIYDFPTASNVVFANGRFWLAWVEEDQLVMSSVRPGDEKPRRTVLNAPAHWNSHLSLAAIGDRLGLAYHCSYNARSRIITRFLKAE